MTLETIQKIILCIVSLIAASMPTLQLRRQVLQRHWNSTQEIHSAISRCIKSCRAAPYIVETVFTQQPRVILNLLTISKRCIFFQRTCTILTLLVHTLEIGMELPRTPLFGQRLRCLRSLAVQAASSKGCQLATSSVKRSAPTNVLQTPHSPSLGISEYVKYNMWVDVSGKYSHMPPSSPAHSLSPLAQFQS